MEEKNRCHPHPDKNLERYPYYIYYSIYHLLDSIAKEEYALANILYHEGEKIDAVVDKYKYCKVNHAELLKTNESVRQMIIAAIKKEMLLEFKLENVIKLYKLAKYR